VNEIAEYLNLNHTRLSQMTSDDLVCTLLDEVPGIQKLSCKKVEAFELLFNIRLYHTSIQEMNSARSKNRNTAARLGV